MSDSMWRHRRHVMFLVGLILAVVGATFEEWRPLLAVGAMIIAAILGAWGSEALRTNTGRPAKRPSCVSR